MKKIIIVGLFSILFAFSSQAQRNYSMENLEQVTPERLNVLLKRAKTKRTIAGVLTGVGITSIILASSDVYMGGGEPFMVVGGVVMSIIVIPVTILNSSRVQKVEGVMKSRYSGVFLEMSPYRFQNNMAMSHQNGVSLRLKF